MQLSDSLSGNLQKARALHGFRFRVWVLIPCMFVRSDGYGKESFGIVQPIGLAARHIIPAESLARKYRPMTSLESHFYKREALDLWTCFRSLNVCCTRRPKCQRTGQWSKHAVIFNHVSTTDPLGKSAPHTD
jgi:hypothetical protein